MKGVWFDPRVADRLRDESPRAYKDVRSVIRAQHALARVTRTLCPLLNYKGACCEGGAMPEASPMESG